jgi:hypothetical protein
MTAIVGPPTYPAPMHRIFAMCFTPVEIAFEGALPTVITYRSCCPSLPPCDFVSILVLVRGVRVLTNPKDTIKRFPDRPFYTEIINEILAGIGFAYERNFDSDG